MSLQKIGQLNPRPGEGYLDRFQIVIPDLIVKEDGEDWIITTNDGGFPELRISKEYEIAVENNNYDNLSFRF